MQQSYLYILWKNSPKLAFIVFAFCCFQLFFTYKQVETLPFFNYGMYSAPCTPKTVYSTISVYENSKKISLFEEQKSPAFLQYQLNYYSKLIAQDSLDYTSITIHKRFGQNSNISNYLVPLLSSPKSSIDQFPKMLKKWTSKDLKIIQENYEWVNFSFKKVNQLQIH